MSLDPDWLHLNEVVELRIKIEDQRAEIERLRADLKSQRELYRYDMAKLMDKLNALAGKER